MGNNWPVYAHVAQGRRLNAWGPGVSAVASVEAAVAGHLPYATCREGPVFRCDRMGR